MAIDSATRQSKPLGTGLSMGGFWTRAKCSGKIMRVKPEIVEHLSVGAQWKRKSDERVVNISQLNLPSGWVTFYTPWNGRSYEQSVESFLRNYQPQAVS